MGRLSKIKRELIQEANRELLQEGKTCWYRNGNGYGAKCSATWEGSGSHGNSCMNRARCLGPRGGDNVVDSDNDGEVTIFKITPVGEDGGRGRTINVDKNHEVIRGADLTKARKGKQLTKGKNLKEGSQTINEGIFCCMVRGGCCEHSHNLPFPHWTRGENGSQKDWAGYHIEWDGCCGNNRRGGCC
tara:strand:- start:55 stop:615 length:561 start_codon:yes stop_codon:yes gene_type:complete